MNGTLYRRGLKQAFRLWLIFAAVLALYFAIIVTMFDPAIGDTLEKLVDAMPEMIAMFGMDAPATTLVQFLATYLYGFLMILLPLVYIILLANKLVARQVERGDMAYLIASPVSRSRVAGTQLAVLVSAVWALDIFAAAVGLIASAAAFPGELDIGRFLLLNGGVIALHTFLLGLCFFASCIADDNKLALGLGAGLPIAFYLIQMLANMGGKLENLRYATPYTLFDPGAIAAGEAALWPPLVLFGAGALLAGLGILLFTRRDLPL
jgi:ABC-2 type transport system permease protein